jgi:oligopeptide transport system permease protein
MRAALARPSARIAIFVLAGLTFFALLAPLLSPHAYDRMDWYAIKAAPSLTHPFGTDGSGRDLLVRCAIGARISLSLGLLATLVALVIGVLWGASAGLAGGRTDLLMMRVVDVLYALPFMFFVMLLMALLGRHLWLVFIGVGAVEWLTMARIVRGQTLSLKAREFIEAARAIGAGQVRLLMRHILPNLAGITLVYATLTVPQVIMVESFLSFLGLGVQEPLTSWGLLIKEGAQEIETAPWLLLFPGLMLTATLMALGLLGDALRDALDAA